MRATVSLVDLLILLDIFSVNQSKLSLVLTGNYRDKLAVFAGLTQTESQSACKSVTDKKSACQSLADKKPVCLQVLDDMKSVCCKSLVDRKPIYLKVFS